MILFLSFLICINSFKIGFNREDININDKIRMTNDEIYTRVDIKECVFTEEIGKPMMPLKIVSVLIPPSASIKSFRIRDIQFVEIPGEYTIFPAQPPMPIKTQNSNLKTQILIDKSAYSSDKSYPDEIVRYTGTGSLGGFRIASFVISALRYVAKERKLFLLKECKIEFEYQYGSTDRARPHSTLKIYKDMVKSLVINPEEVDLLTPPVYEPKDEMLKQVQHDKQEEYAYLIITDSSFCDAFLPLCDWKTRKGVPAIIKSTQEIYDEYGGGVYDEAEAVRNFICDKHREGAVWVLLGGDVYYVPYRGCYGKVWEHEDNDIPCDLYFSDVDGDWDSNGNGIYGETSDNVDLYPDVFVGRAPVNNIQEVQGFVNKVLTYEKGITPDYELKVLFTAEYLDQYTDGSIGKDMILNYIPARFNVTRLYTRFGNLNKESAVDSLNVGFNIYNHIGHGNVNYMSVGNDYGEGPDYLTSSDIFNLTNAPKFTVLYSIACLAASFEKSCIAEAFVRNANGGGFFVGNSRVSFYYLGNPGAGVGEKYDQSFFNSLFNNDIYRIGRTLADSKNKYIGYSHSNGGYRWVQYTLNLLGDPEMAIWTDTPESLTVTVNPDPLPASPHTITITVKSLGSPVEDVLVCLQKKSDVYVYGSTNASGTVQFSISPTTPDTMFITATAHNYFPSESWTAVGGDDYPMLRVSTHSIYDGNNNIPEAGEVCSLVVTLVNLTPWQDAYNIVGMVTTDDSFITIVDNSVNFSDIPAGSTGDNSSSPFVVSLSDTCPLHITKFTLHIESEPGGYTYTDTFLVRMELPPLLLVDDDCDGDFETWYESTLQNIPIVYDKWEISEKGVPSSFYLQAYPVVIWFTGNDSITTLTSEEQDVLSSFLDNGGNLFVTGQNIGQDIGGGNFYGDYLHTQFIAPTTDEYILEGVDGDEIGDGVNLAIMVGGAGNQNSKDIITPISGADSCILYPETGNTAGVKWAGSYKVVYFGFGFEGVANRGGFTTREQLMARILGWLGLEVGIEDEEKSEIRMTKSEIKIYPNPFNTKTSIQYIVDSSERKNKNLSTIYHLPSTICIYDLSGRLIRSFSITQSLNHSITQVTWDGTDDNGKKVPSGVYFIKIRNPNDDDPQAGAPMVRKVMLIR